MPRVPRFWGPRAYSLLFFPNFFVTCFSAGPQRTQVPQKTWGPKILKSEAPKAGPKTVFSPVSVFQRFQCFSVFSVSARGPKEPKSLRKREAPKSKKRGPKKRGPKRFFPLFQCFSVFSVSAYSVFQRGAPKSPEYVRPQDLKIEAPQSGASNGFFLPCFKQTARGHKIQTARGQESKAPKSEALK
jgi:hypothetical protein